MKLKITFDLSKILAQKLKTRIELRQIGVRDEAKLLGGIGPCGRSLCCSTFLGDFEPVSIKMAKDQNLSLNFLLKVKLRLHLQHLKAHI